MICDELASEKVRRELIHLLPALQQLPPEHRQKAYVTIAWSYIHEGNLEEALKYLDQLDPEYIQGPMLAQMAADRAFDQMAEKVAKALVDNNIHIPVYNVGNDAYVHKRQGVA